MAPLPAPVSGSRWRGGSHGARPVRWQPRQTAPGHASLSHFPPPDSYTPRGYSSGIAEGADGDRGAEYDDRDRGDRDGYAKSRSLIEEVADGKQHRDAAGERDHADDEFPP